MNAAAASAFQNALPRSFAQLLRSCSVFVDALLALELFNLLPVVPVVLFFQLVLLELFGSQ